MSKKKWIIIVSVVVLTLLIGQFAVFAVDKMSDGFHGQYHEGNMTSGMGNMMNGNSMEGMMGNMMNGTDMESMMEQCKIFLDTDA